MAYLNCMTGYNRGQTIPLGVGSTMIGRLASSDVQVIDRRVSREHCRIWFDAATQTFMIADLGSANGTYVNGVRLEREQVLQDLDEVLVGDTILQIRDVPSKTPKGRTILRGQELQDTDRLKTASRADPASRRAG